MQNSKDKYSGYKKVFYNKGDNNNFDYYIIAEKKDVEINQNSLAFKMDNSQTTAKIISEINYSGNFDYIICEVNKNSKEEKRIPCLYGEIQI